MIDETYKRYQVIRGERILQQQKLLEVSSVDDLESNIVRAFPTTRKRQHATGDVTISNVQIIPYVGMKMLHVRAQAASVSGARYQLAVQFVRVDFESSDTEQNATFKATDGQDYHILPVKLTGNYVKVRCNCMDFHYRFAAYNSQDKSLVGRPPPPYQKKTNRPPVNPDQVPGMCKHLLKLVSQLQGQGLIVD